MVESNSFPETAAASNDGSNGSQDEQDRFQIVHSKRRVTCVYQIEKDHHLVAVSRSNLNSYILFLRQSDLFPVFYGAGIYSSTISLADKHLDCFAFNRAITYDARRKIRNKPFCRLWTLPRKSFSLVTRQTCFT
jgi:hypothetical protein